MPKVKRFQNPQKSSLQPPTNSLPSTNPTPTNETSSNTSMITTPPIDSSLPTENSQQPETSTQHVRRESSSYWIVHAIGICHIYFYMTIIFKILWLSKCFMVKDLEGVIKKIKVKVGEVNNLPRGERIIVDFDELGMAIGEGKGVLAGYCGTLAIDCNLFPINFERWSGKTGMPDTYFLERFKEILQVYLYACMTLYLL